MPSPNPLATKSPAATTKPITTGDLFPSAKSLGLNDPGLINQALIVGGIIGCMMLLSLFMKRNRSAKVATARWATIKEIKAANKAGLQSVLKKSVTNPTLWIAEPIGKAYPRIGDLKNSRRITYTSKSNQSIIVLGTSGSGKTRTVIDPLVKSAIEQGFPVMLFDAKYPNQASHIVPYAKECGYSIKVFAPGESFPESDTFNFFDAFKGVNDPSIYAVQICATIRKNTKEAGAKSDPFFDENGAKIAAGAMVLAQHIAEAENRPDLANMLFAYSILDLPDLPQRIEAAKTALPLAVRTLFKSLLSSGEDKGKNKTQGSLLATAEQILGRFALPALIPSCCNRGTFPGFDPKEPLKLEGKQLCVFGLDQDADAVVAPILAAAIEQIGTYCLNNSRPRKDPMLLCLDEFPALNLPVVKKWQAEKRSMGLVAILGVQNPSQFDDVYGQGAAKGFMARASTHIILNPGDWEAAESISKSLGEEEIRVGSRSTSRNRGKNSSASISSSMAAQKRRLISAEDVLQLPEGACIIRTPIVRSVGRSFTDEQMKIPYRKRFEVDNTAIDLEEARSEKVYAQMCKMVANSKADQKTDEISIRRTIDEHYAILEKIIPQPAKPDTSESSPTSQRWVTLSAVVAKMRHAGFSVQELPDRKIVIPDDFPEILSVEDCKKLLNTEGINLYEHAKF